MIQAVRT